MANCLFCKIVNKDIPSKIIFEDDELVAFEDVNPRAPCHFLVVPKEHIGTLNDIDVKSIPLVGKIILKGAELAKEKGLGDNGYRLVWNCNDYGGQTVFHLHLHVLGGRQMSWPPG